MNTKQTIPNSKSLDFSFTTEGFKKDFDSILSFIKETCEISSSFILINIDGQNILVSTLGLNQNFDVEKIPFLDILKSENENTIISNFDSFYKTHNTNSNLALKFFAGFPVKTPNKSVSGSLCVLDSKITELDDRNLRIIKQCASQIESLLNLNLKNSSLESQIDKNYTIFESVIENSNEIVFELSTEGTLKYVSSNWSTFLGYEIKETRNKNIATYIHPEDIEKFNLHLKNIIKSKSKGHDITYRILHKKGYYLWHSAKINLIKKAPRNFFVGNCRDITEYINNEQKLKQQKDFYEKILDRLPTDVAVFSPEHKYLYLNPVAIKDDNLRKFAIGKDDIEYATQSNRNIEQAVKRIQLHKEAVQRKKTIEWLETLYDKKGEISYHQRKLTPVFSRNGELELIIGFSVDVTESKKIQNEILENRRFTKSIIENIPVGIIVQGPDSAIIEFNKAANKLLGLQVSKIKDPTEPDKYWEIIGENGSLIKKEDLPSAQVINNLKPIHNKVIGLKSHSNKKMTWLLVDCIPIFNEWHDLEYVISSFSDITNQKNAEEDLKISKVRFENVTKATSDMVWDWNLLTDQIIFGENFEAFYGRNFSLDKNQLTGKMIEDFVHPEDRHEMNLKREQLLINKNERFWQDEFRFLKPDGKYAFLKNKAYIIRNPQGVATRIIGAFTDITQEKKLKDELESSEKKFKDIFNFSSVGIGIVNYDGYWLDANRRLCHILGYSVEELKTITFIDLTHPDDIKENLSNKQKLISNEIPFFEMEKRYIHKNGKIIWVNLSVSPITDENKKITQFVTQIIDITERKRIEEENRILIEENNRNRNIQLNEAKNLYRLLADNTIDIVGLHDLEMKFQYVSPSIKGITGFTPEEIIGKTPMELAHPDDIKGMADDLQKFMTGNLSHPIQYRYLNAKGQYIWLETIAKLVLKDGEPYQIQTSTRDVTQRKSAELAIERTLKRQQELNELRTNLVSTISHEFRTPMTTIRTSAELIEMYIEGQSVGHNDHLRRQIKRIIDEIDRIVELMNAVLTISKDDSGKTKFIPTKFDLKELCQNVIETSFSQNKDYRKVEMQFEGNDFLIYADKNLVQYSLFNILNNAFKYSEGTRDVQLKIKENEATIEIDVIDFGIGIPAEDQPKLFNTFFRASNTDGIQGTGLGLYIVKTFIEKNSGNIHLESKLGKGTKITIELPKA